MGLTACQLVAGVNSGTGGLHRYETHTQYFYVNFIVPPNFSHSGKNGMHVHVYV